MHNKDTTMTKSTQNLHKTIISQSLDKAHAQKSSAQNIKPTTVLSQDPRILQKISTAHTKDNHSAQASADLHDNAAGAPNTHANTTHESPMLKKLGNVDDFSPTNQKVSLVISGTTHHITCPKSRVASINKTADAINNSLRKMRNSIHGKSPTNEELLVLHCLSLYDKITSLENTQKI